MVFRRVIGRTKNNQRGFTLVEIVVALALVGIIASASTATIFQVLDGNVRSNNHLTAIKQLENAIHWLNRDIQMAQDVQPDEDDGFPLSLTWTEWDNTVNEVTYSLEDSQLKRSHSIDGEMVVARYIDTDSEMTSCNFTGGILAYKLTATISSGSQETTETRVGEIISRPNSP